MEIDKQLQGGRFAFFGSPYSRVDLSVYMNFNGWDYCGSNVVLLLSIVLHHHILVKNFG
jgi:hypothetical protein